jgi:CRP-like cAMP-binding protein
VRVTTPVGDVATLAVLGPGEGFGEGAILHPDSRRTATVVALEATETLSLTGAEFARLCQRCPSVSDLLLHHLARQVERLTAQVVDALYLPSDKRVLRCLLSLDDAYGGDDIPLTQDDLATMAGTTRSTANRVLNGLVTAGAVSVGRRRMAVLDRDAVTRRAR